MKVCPKCTTSKPFEEFGKHKRRRDGLQTYCKLCVKGINAEYYKKTPEKNPQRWASKDRAKQFVVDYLRTHPCVDCPESDPVVLEFDHVRGEKEFNISDATIDGVGLERLAAEIAKCDVRCANCHRRITAQRGNWFVYRLTL